MDSIGTGFSLPVSCVLNFKLYVYTHSCQPLSHRILPLHPIYLIFAYQNQIFSAHLQYNSQVVCYMLQQCVVYTYTVGYSYVNGEVPSSVFFFISYYHAKWIGKIIDLPPVSFPSQFHKRKPDEKKSCGSFTTFSGFLISIPRDAIILPQPSFYIIFLVLLFDTLWRKSRKRLNGVCVSIWVYTYTLQSSSWSKPKNQMVVTRPYRTGKLTADNYKSILIAKCYRLKCRPVQVCIHLISDGLLYSGIPFTVPPRLLSTWIDKAIF